MMAGKQQQVSDWSVLRHTPPPPTSCCPSLLTFPDCLPASETPSNTQWHLEKEKKKGVGGNYLSGRRDRENEKLYALTSSDLIVCRQQGPKGKDIRRSTKGDCCTKGEKKRFSSLLKRRRRQRGGKGGDAVALLFCSLAVSLLWARTSSRGPSAGLVYPKPQSCKGCSFLLWSSEPVKPSNGS